MKPFFITIDTEGDSLWDNPRNEEITTENVLWIPRFQELCEKYGFIPIWLTDFEIISDSRFVDYIRNKAQNELCEVGIHVHARNTPPIVTLKDEFDNRGAYLIEYPMDIATQKFCNLKSKIEEKIGLPVVTHRAGRWALNKEYINLLVTNGIKYDCSVTPGIDWSEFTGITPGSRGSNYSTASNHKFYLDDEKIVAEFPVSIYDCKKVIRPNEFTPRLIMKSIYHYFMHSKIWLRPNSDNNLNDMKYILKEVIDKDYEFVEFMIHSSEFMPGGSRNFPTSASVEKLFDCMDKLFSYAKTIGYEGYTFQSWERKKRG